MTIQSLEWNTLKTHLEPYAKTQKGRTLIQSLEVFDRSEMALKSMHEIAAAKNWIERHPHPDFGSFFDLATQLKDIKIERILSISDQLRVLQFLKGVDRLLVRFKSVPPEINIDSVKPYSLPLDSLKKVRELLALTYEPERVLDSASSELKSTRQLLSKTEKQLNDKLKTIVEKNKADLSEGFFTQRHGRYVLPVKITVKNRFKGSVVDYSASGETVYMEPTDVGELSAEKRRLEALEAAEIERILQATSAILHEHYEILNINFKHVSELDVIFAKAHYALDIDAHLIEFSSRLNLLEARHPFIPMKDVVANTITLSPPHRVMIISGSNTGGKTVVLKTVGICALMAKAGLLIPASKGSSIPFFEQIFADIGDEQSIEQSLSTFSSHLTQIIEMVQKATSNDLIILDELGSGTDPQAGAALARALMDHFRALKAHLFVTTHYPDLKAYAYDHEDVINASVAFDTKTLKPTYQLFLDTPGESHAFLIAERLGLNPTVIKKAQSYHQQASSPVSQLIQTLEEKKVEIEKDRLVLDQLLKKVNQDKSEILQMKTSLQEERRTYKDKLKRQSQLEMETLKEELDQTLEALKASSHIKMHELQATKALLNRPLDSERAASTEVIEVGDRVEIKKFNRPGQVKSIKKGTYTVIMGNLELKLQREDVTFLRKDDLNLAQDAHVNTPPRKAISAECDLRGLRVEEAQEMLLKYIDDCSVDGVPFVRIIHGFGTLALRKMVKEVVQSSPLVTSSRDGQGNEGGNGVTVIYFE
jgi:DNA mismatch repair protein MutS2